MSTFSNVSRRRFITIATASTGAMLLKGCLGNPPETATNQNPVAANSVADLKPEVKPEVKAVKLGYLPIVEAAPLIVAKEKGLFAKYGMPDVEISKQANWGSARDNVKIGAAGGGIDGGQWQMPMPYLISEGIITDNTKVPMYVLAQLNTQGNGIALASKHQGKGVSIQIAEQVAFFDKVKSEGSKFKAAYTFPKANQEFWIRYWLAGNGIDPDSEVELLTVPTAQTMADMKRGAMDAFSTGDPWPYRIVTDKIGFIPALTAEIWKNHPEEY